MFAFTVLITSKLLMRLCLLKYIFGFLCFLLDYASGFGGKFGVQRDRQDKSAVGWEHIEKCEKHESQKDYKTGFGGQFGVQNDRQDKSAVGWEHQEKLTKHESQKGISAIGATLFHITFLENTKEEISALVSIRISKLDDKQLVSKS